jgi:hypothetical protein
MSEYIHHITGRLRLKLAQIRKQPQRAQDIQSAACRISGVKSVETNIVTGSLLIRYDAAAVNAESIMLSMKGMGLLSSTAGSREMPYRSPVTQQRAAPSPLANKVVDMLVEKLIERSAIALVGALL